jgi:hypothetical protein
MLCQIVASVRAVEAELVRGRAPPFQPGKAPHRYGAVNSRRGHRDFSAFARERMPSPKKASPTTRGLLQPRYARSARRKRRPPLESLKRTSIDAGRRGLWIGVSEASSTPGAPVAAVVAGGQTTFVLADPGGGIYAHVASRA